MPRSESVQIIQTPFYSAYQYDHAVGIILEPGTTDADPQSRIEETWSEKDEHGNINHFVIADKEKLLLWKCTLGKILANFLLKEDMSRQGDRWTANSDSTLLSDLPAGYQLYVHKTGKHYDPRQDAYLYGSRHVTVFRSPAEFAYHLIWLMSGSPLKDGQPDCDCTYCDGTRPQTEISRALGLRRTEDREDRASGGSKRGRKGDDGASRRRRKKSPSPASIPAKDYTKLNQT